MKFIFTLALIGGVFCFTSSFAQDVQKNKTGSEIDSKLPKYQVTGHELKDIATYNYAVVDYYADRYEFPVQKLEQPNLSPEEKNSLIRQWNKENPDQAVRLKINTIEDYQKIVFENQLYNYPPKPVFVDTGDARQDELNHKMALKAWSEAHPDYPKYMDTGDPEKDKNAFRLAKLEFYDKYLKN